MSTVTVIADLKAAISARKDSLITLRQRLTNLLEPIPIGVTLSDEQGEVCHIARVVSGASQWSNRRWEITLTGWAAISPRGRLVCDEIEDSMHDGNNMHWNHGEGTRLTRDGSDLLWEPGTITRQIAARLPAAIARYMDECQAETQLNAACAAR